MNAPVAMTQAKFSEAEIADLLGVARRSVNRWAQAESWPCIQELERGLVVKKYLVGLLPGERRAAIAKVTTATAEAGALAVVEHQLPKLAELKGWQREVMDARVALFREFQRLERKYGTNRAIREFIQQANSDSLPEPLQKMVAVANARGGKTGRKISKSMIFRWKDMDKKGIAAFAPKDVEKKEVPLWAPFFMKCYQLPSNPSIPQAMEEMKKILPGNITMPSYQQVRRFHDKRSRLDRERGRKTGSAMKALQGYRQRDTSELRPMDVGVCDGHSFKAKVSHPIHGRPFKPELCAIIDAATRALVGWSAGLAESATTVADAVRHAATVNENKRYGGVFNILYTDGGSGNKAQINTDEFTGLFPRLGTMHKVGIPGNAQGRGIIERLNATLWIRAAKKLPTFVGKEMDTLTKRNVYLLVEKDVRKNGKSDTLMSWPVFLAFVQDEVDAYNRRPHSGLPKINDPDTGLRRHMSPFEAWAWHSANGWRQEDHQLTEQEVEILFRPRVSKKVVRSSISLGTNTYFNSILAHYNGEDVQVGYDIHDASKVQVWDREGRLICYALFEQNKDHFFPLPLVEKAANDRAKRRAKIKMDNLAEIEAERRGVIDLRPAGKVIEITSAQGKIKADREALQLEMQVKASTVSIPEDDKGKFLFWNGLDARLQRGETLEKKEMLFYEAYRKSASFRAFKSVADMFGQQARQ